MKQVKVTILVDIDPIVYNDHIKDGYTDKNIMAYIKENFNSAKIYYRLVSDFEVESVEVKA